MPVSEDVQYEHDSHSPFAAIGRKPLGERGAATPKRPSHAIKRNWSRTGNDAKMNLCRKEEASRVHVKEA